MDMILNAIKCSICRELLESPVILPCNDIVCKKHVSNQTNDLIRCEKCGVEHVIPANGFLSVPSIETIIKSGIGQMNFGSVHKEAKNSCESFEDTLKKFEVILKDPYFYTHEKISELKNTVQLKGEQLKLIIEKEMKKQIDRLEEYEIESKEYLLTNEFNVESKKLENELKTAQSNLDSWLESLNKIEFDKEKWQSIIEESDKELKNVNNKLDEFKNKLLLNKFDENWIHVNCFKNIKIETDKILEPIKINKSFLDSIIINESLPQKLEELLVKKYLNDRKWSLLYQGSRDGFGASDFHSHCDNKQNTLTIVKSRNGNIFGGFTRAEWNPTDSWQDDKSSFIYSLVNKENRQLLFEYSSKITHSIGSYKESGPEFGCGIDLFISGYSNINKNSYSNLGYTYAHPEYPYGSDKAKSILAGTYNFQVQEIEVFQMQP